MVKKRGQIVSMFTCYHKININDKKTIIIHILNYIKKESETYGNAANY